MSCEIIHPPAFQRRPDTDDPDRDPPAPAAACAGGIIDTGALPTPSGFHQREYSYGAIAGKLGIGNYRKASSITHIMRTLIEEADMPAPKGYRIRRAGSDGKPMLIEGAAMVRQNARWDADLFDAWQLGQLPPSQRAARLNTAQSTEGAALDANADRLFGGARA